MLTPNDQKISQKYNRAHLLNMEQLHAKYENCKRSQSSDIALTRFSVFDPKWPRNCTKCNMAHLLHVGNLHAKYENCTHLQSSDRLNALYTRFSVFDLCWPQMTLKLHKPKWGSSTPCGEATCQIWICKCWWSSDITLTLTTYHGSRSHYLQGSGFLQLLHRFSQLCQGYDNCLITDSCIRLNFCNLRQSWLKKSPIWSVFILENSNIKLNKQLNSIHLYFPMASKVPSNLLYVALPEEQAQSISTQGSRDSRLICLLAY